MLSPKPLHAVAPLIATAALGLAACGGGGDGASSPLDEALGYLPEDAAIAFIASTDPDDYDDVQKLVEKFPFGGRFEDGLRQGLEGSGVNYEEDIKPLLGNEVVIGTAADAAAIADDAPYVLALEVEDEGKLNDLLKKRDPQDKGESEGHDIYFQQEQDTWIAVKDDVVVFASDEDALRAAVKQRGQDDRLAEEDVEDSFEDLPEDAPIRVYVGLRQILEASPEAREALKVKWVDHMETLGLAADVTEDSVSIEYSLRTDPEGLSDDDLPMAAGGDAPQLLEREEGSSEIVLGLRDPSQVVDFALATAKTVDPAGYAQFETGKKAVGKRLGIDIDDDVLAQLTGDLTAAVSLDGKFGVRAELEDAEAFEDTLAKVMKGLPEFADEVTVTPPRAGDRFYGLATEDGKSYAVGVAEGSLVVANDAELASEVATRRLVDAKGQEGAFVSVADAERLANEALARFAGGLEGIGGSLFTGPLGALTSSAEASTEGISGSLTLEIE